MTLKNICLIGANGNLGPFILSALLAAKKFNITVLSRRSSKSTFPSEVEVKTISDDPDHEELVPLLRGQDALVVTFAGSNSALQILLADAAAEAGVKRFIPADFGSCDSSSKLALELMPLYGEKKKVREYLQDLVSKKSGLSWTSLVCGHFFDYGLTSDLLLFDVKTQKVLIFDNGNIKWSTTTRQQIGEAVAKILEKEDATRNRMLYMQSFCVTQNEVLEAFKSATTQDWEVEHVASKDFIKQEKAKIDKDPKDHEALEKLVGVVGIIDANWEEKEDFANDLLELEKLNLSRTVRDAIKPS